MRIFALTGLLVVVTIIGFAAAAFLSFATAPMAGVSGVAVTDSSTEDTDAAYNVVDRARMAVSMDNERQRVLQDQMDRLDGATWNP